MNAVSNVSTRMILLQERERIKWRKEIISVLSTFLFFFFLSIICFVYGIQFQTKNIKRYLSKYEWLETFVFLSFTLPSSSRAWRTHTRRKLGDSLDFECSLHRHNSNLQKVICRLERTMEKNSEDNRISILYNKSCLKQSLLNYIPSTFECCLFLFKKIWRPHVW